MPTERDRVRKLMLRHEPVPADDMVVARMIIADATRLSRVQGVFFALALALLVFVVARGLTTHHWDWFVVVAASLLLVSTTRQLYVQRRARGWAARYLPPEIP